MNSRWKIRNCYENGGKAKILMLQQIGFIFYNQKKKTFCNILVLGVKCDLDMFPKQLKQKQPQDKENTYRMDSWMVH